MNLPGTFKAQKKDGSIYYRSSITYKNKHISLGSYGTQQAAHQAYLEASLLLENSQILLEDYDEDNTLSFEKWVILTNFRDNHIYFSTPIYVRKKLFHYYLSRQIRLTFDMEDLFFYASHKITQRKGHLFVADYGMQITITSRYGIKNYGVEGKDYRFINGDNHDFRYENIEILNPYQGVEKVSYHKKECYASKINLNGYYLIGHYPTALEAAIAYNKAIDLLKKRGVTKNFFYNEMEGVSPSHYANLYSQLKISEKILHYRAE